MDNRSGQPKGRLKQKSHGFTVVELLVVIVVLAIASAIVVPRIGKADTNKLRAAARMLAADLQVTQSEAMAHPDEVRILDWNLGGALRYDIASFDTPGAPDPSTQVITNPLTKSPYRVEYSEGAAYQFLDGVWLAKSNLNVSGHAGHIHFGAYGQVDLPADSPTMVLAASDHTLTVEVETDTGNVTVANDFGLLSDVGSIAMPGPAGQVHTQATSPY